LAQGGSVQRYGNNGKVSLDDTTYFQDPLGVDTTQDMDTSNLSFKDLLPDLRQKVQPGKTYTPGISGTLFGYKVMPPDVSPYTDEALRLQKLHPSKVGSGRGTMPPEAYAPEVKGETNKVTEPKQASLMDEEMHLADLYPPKGITSIDAEKMPPPEEKPVAAPEKDDLREYFSKGIAGLEDQKKINAYMALLSAGLGMMGGTSPYAAANIGTGAQQGVQAYMAGNKDITAQQNALMQGRLGLEKYQSLRDIQKQQAQNLAEYRQDKVANQNAERDRRILAGKESANLAQQKLAETHMKNLDEALARKEREATALAVAQEKNAFTPEQHAQIQAQAIANLHKRPDYQQLYKLRYGELPMGAQQQSSLSQADADLVNKYLKKP
jgi:hypothetical protein